MKKFWFATTLLLVTSPVMAHSGGQDANGGHRDKQTGKYHCHKYHCEIPRQPVVGDVVYSAPQKPEYRPGDTSAKGIYPAYVRAAWLPRWPIVKDAEALNMGCLIDLRHKMLRDNSAVDVVIEETKAGKCRVRAGAWPARYVAGTLYRPKQLDLDHIIPLEYAHRNGGHAWSASTKLRFATDPDNLVLAKAQENRRKGARGPTRYYPKTWRCGYADRWELVAQKYGLVLPEADSEFINKVQWRECGYR